MEADSMRNVRFPHCVFAFNEFMCNVRQCSARIQLSFPSPLSACCVFLLSSSKNALSRSQPQLWLYWSKLILFSVWRVRPGVKSVFTVSFRIFTANTPTKLSPKYAAEKTISTALAGWTYGALFFDSNKKLRGMIWIRLVLLWLTTWFLPLLWRL